jgi:hypothetical protein
MALTEGCARFVRFGGHQPRPCIASA